LSDATVAYAFEQLEPSDPPPRDAPERIIAEAQAEALQIREQARAEGHAEGRSQGHADGVEQMRSATDALGEALQSIEALRLQVAEALERDAIEFALALAEKILVGALGARRELVIDVAEGALRRISDRRHVTVLVNPSDLELIKGAAEDLRGRLSGIEGFEVQAEDRVAIGGAIARTTEGEVDASVQTQLERAREVIFAQQQDELPA